MTNKVIEVFSEVSNFGIVRMPGRRFPGCVIQGDSLSVLLDLAESVCDRVRNSTDEELVSDAEELRTQIAERLRHYESVLDEHGLSLPYARRAR